MTNNPFPNRELDCVGMKCPAPILQVAREASSISKEGGGVLVVTADDPAFRPDVEAWARASGAQLLEWTSKGSAARVVIRVAEHGQRLPSAPASVEAIATTLAATVGVQPNVSLDLRGLQCPGPIVSLAKAANEHPPGAVLRVLADDDAFPIDLRSWIKAGRAELLSLDETGPHIEAILRLRPSTGLPAARPASQSGARIDTVAPPSGGCTLLVLHNDFEALLAALLVANGSAAQGMETSLFFTFWGLNLLRGDHPDPTQPRERVGFMRRLMKWMMPKGPSRQKLGKMHYGGVGKAMMSSLMRRENILGLPELMRSAQDLGVTFTACTMSMSVMGITKRDLYPYPNLEFAGVATFVERSRNSSVSLVF